MNRALGFAVAVMLFVAPVSYAGEGKPRSWSATARILLPGATLLTMTEWGTTCPSMPVSQGVSGYVFEIPAAFGAGNALAHVQAKSRAPTPTPAGFFLLFKNSTCRTLASAGEGVAEVPIGTKYVFVTNYFDANEQIELTLQMTGRDRT